MSESIITEVEARHKADSLAKGVLSLVLSESRRVAEQFVAAERSATRGAADSAADSRAAAAREGEVISLEAHALAKRVSSTLQRGIDGATENLASAQRKEDRENSGRVGSSSNKEILGGEEVKQAQVEKQVQEQGQEQEQGRGRDQDEGIRENQSESRREKRATVEEEDENKHNRENTDLQRKEEGSSQTPSAEALESISLQKPHVRFADGRHLQLPGG